MKTLIAICLLATASASFVGCGKKNEAPQTQQEYQAAVAAPFGSGELKAKYDAVNSALAANNFAGVKAAYDDLARQPSLTPDQQSALAQLRIEIFSKAVDASKKGDRTATAILDKMRP